jgi:hypothetical protein
MFPRTLEGFGDDDVAHGAITVVLTMVTDATRLRALPVSVV